jgi:hypothetical protein
MDNCGQLQTAADNYGHFLRIRIIFSANGLHWWKGIYLLWEVQRVNFQRESWAISFLKQQFGVQVVSIVLYRAQGNNQWKPKDIRELS